MSKSIADVRKEMVAKYNTKDQQYSDFPIGTAVKVIVPCEDFTFFSGETGVVIKNSGNYLGIIVKFDEKYNRPDFGFKPEDLIVINNPTPSTQTIRGEIDNVLDEFADFIFSMILAKKRPSKASKLTIKKANQATDQIIQLILDRVIGVDEPEDTRNTTQFLFNAPRNKLRQSQRNKVEESKN